MNLLALISWYPLITEQSIIQKFLIDNFSDQREQEFKSFTEVCLFESASKFF